METWVVMIMMPGKQTTHISVIHMYSYIIYICIAISYTYVYISCLQVSWIFKTLWKPTIYQNQKSATGCHQWVSDKEIGRGILLWVPSTKSSKFDYYWTILLNWHFESRACQQWQIWPVSDKTTIWKISQSGPGLDYFTEMLMLGPKPKASK